MSLIHSGPLEFTSSYNAALQFFSKLLRKYKEVVSRDYIQSLPDDVLSQIIHEALFSQAEIFHVRYHPKDAICMSHVCRRFYSLITEDSRFWEWPLYRRESAEILEACMARSKDKGLHVIIMMNFLDTKISPDFIDTFIPYQERWETLNIDLERIHSRQWAILKAQFENVNPSRLERLRISYGGRLSIDFDETELEWGPQMDILSTAHLPRLRIATFVNCIPQPFALATITHLNIEFGSPRWFDSNFLGWD